MTMISRVNQSSSLQECMAVIAKKLSGYDEGDHFHYADNGFFCFRQLKATV